ncbi:hypothetical protein Pmar_PMAR008963 [Perkinsus marinus ATCC 50983]|uniref:Uncharacterized protein n=1 Tax=Perkinsus marinus (strain ATCC 50983 / TXsc) TaxID=423536 RepID=C5LM51_PERM5|nr:hypothetical protein Pmar_PMAR008963 [Perkinsus marinus ATCC 50983]EER02182.1 hypothetical protein Pmar_PMAR008963 [Perkinsus marinus ATCC 50983]|eukprot:XP_002769464.1 hypothetical protein Pmar_PMAR008963 [Perkinsus marinus ATCC 50983]
MISSVPSEFDPEDSPECHGEEESKTSQREVTWDNVDYATPHDIHVFIVTNRGRYEGLKEVASTPAEARPVRCNREEFTDPVERENAEFATLYSVCAFRLGCFEAALEAACVACEIDPTDPKPFAMRIYLRVHFMKQPYLSELKADTERLNHLRSDGQRKAFEITKSIVLDPDWKGFMRVLNKHFPRSYRMSPGKESARYLDQGRRGSIPYYTNRNAYRLSIERRYRILSRTGGRAAPYQLTGFLWGKHKVTQAAGHSCATECPYDIIMSPSGNSLFVSGRDGCIHM